VTIAASATAVSGQTLGRPFTFSFTTPTVRLLRVAVLSDGAGGCAVYAPRNYNGRFRGPLLARRALAGSENVPAVALASRLGAPNLLRFLRSAGFDTFDRTAAYYGLGLTLGDAEACGSTSSSPRMRCSRAAVWPSRRRGSARLAA
jgi:penicillin-binding protein 1C